ncbi:hypothetical protein TWF594_004854 [Orbilia oligospora]|nr:hypothetical protein TWF594_004854 [Orbilia oligospora]
MATDTDVHRIQSHSPSPNLKHEPNCYIPWSSSDWHSNRSPVPTIKDEDFEGSDYNSSHSWYTINHNSYSDMGPITYQDNGIESNQGSTYPSYRARDSVSPPASDRRSRIYCPGPPLPPPMNVVSSNVSPGLSSRGKSHYSTAPIGSPSLYGSSPRTSSISVGNSSMQFPSQILKYNEPSLNSVSENQSTSLPSSFSGTSSATLTPPAMNRTHSGPILKSNERRLFNPAHSSLPQISFQQNSPDAPPPSSDIKTEFEPSPHAHAMFGHNGSPYQKHEFEPTLQTMYPMTLPTMAPVHPTPFTNGAGGNTYFTPHAAHLDGVPTHHQHPQGLLTESFGEPNGHAHTHGYRPKREYGIMEGYGHWSTPDGMPMPKPVKRRKSSATQPWQLSDDDRYLIKLKDEDQLPWKEIVLRFKEEGRGNHRVPALQMRLKRIKERIRQWSPEDEKLLDDAKKWIDKHYWEIVASKMVEYGRKEKIPGTSCEKKWKELNARRESEPKSGPGRLPHDDLPPNSQSHSNATSPATNYSGYEEEEEVVC